MPILGACIVAQASVHATQTNWQSLSSISRRGKPPHCRPYLGKRIRLLSRLESSAARKAAKPAPNGFQPNGVAKSPSERQRPGGRMTAEIAVLNRAAIALAADSAVTVQSDHGGHKVFNTTRKIFRLSLHEPVGIMFYDNALFMGVPWETVVKLYRNRLGITKLATLDDYRKDFVDFLETKLPLSNDDKLSHVYALFNSYFSTVQQQLRSEIRRRLRDGQAVNATAMRRMLTRIISDHRRVVVSRNAAANFAGATAAALRAIYGQQLTEAIDENFNGGDLTPAGRAALEDFALNALFRDYLSEQFSGIVIAGFGDDEIFPGISDMHVDGLIDGKLKFRLTRQASVRQFQNSGVVAFAQTEMAIRFMEGIDPSYREYLEDAIPSLMEQLSNRIIDQHVPGTAAQKLAIKRGVNRVGRRVINAFERTAREFRMTEFVNPVVEAVEVLPKEDLAEMAEAMVKLTSMKRRVSLDLETVGGAIDVAVISKGDGFVWIRRKSYYDRALNPHLSV
jgi:hypothetical protein